MRSRYDRLAEHLGILATPVITMTFIEIEAIIGELPSVARHDPGWWGTAASGHYYFAHAAHWERVGYAADAPDLATESVTFRRIKP